MPTLRGLMRTELDRAQSAARPASDDWFAANAPPAGTSGAPNQVGIDPIRSSQVMSTPGSGKSGDVHADFLKATQGLQGGERDLATSTQVADRLKAMGYDASVAPPDAQGRSQGLVIDGQLYRTIDSSNNWTFLPSDNNWSAWGGGGNTGGQTGSMSQPFTPPPAWSEKFVGPTASDLEGDTAYQEQLKRGQQAIERSAAARGTVLNPGTLKDLSDWTAGTASQEMDKLYGRKAQEYGQRYQQYKDAYGLAANTFGINYGVWNDDANRFERAQDRAFGEQLSLAQLGLAGAGGATGAGENYAVGGGNALTGAANAQASGYVGSANAWNNAIGNATNYGTSLYALSRYGMPRGPLGRYTPGLIGE